MNKKYHIKNNHCAEFITAFYINSFIVLKPILNRYSNISTWILVFEIVVMLFVYLISAGFFLNKERFCKMIIFFFCVTAIFLLDFLFRPTFYTWENYYYFLIYGAITAFWLVNVSDFGKLLIYWSAFAIIGGCILITDPFHHYALSGGYMGFGSGMLPAFTACMVVFEFYGEKKVSPLLIVFLMEIILYANKGAIFSVAGIILFLTICLPEEKKKRRKRAVLIFVSGLVFCFFFSFILEILVSLAGQLGIGSYSLSDAAILQSSGLHLKNLSSYSVRVDIWKQAIEEFRDHFVLGMGIGGFEEKYGNYPHNFILDLLVTHGIVIASVILGMLGKSIKNTIDLKNRELYTFSLVTLLLGILPMTFSFTYWKMNMFWLFLILNLFFRQKMKNCGAENTNSEIQVKKYENIDTYL